MHGDEEDVLEISVVETQNNMVAEIDEFDSEDEIPLSVLATKRPAIEDNNKATEIIWTNMNLFVEPVAFSETPLEAFACTNSMTSQKKI